jgi:hypothetical protein
VSYSEPERLHAWVAVIQGAYIHVLKEERAHTVGKDMEELSKCWCQVLEV